MRKILYFLVTVMLIEFCQLHALSASERAINTTSMSDYIAVATPQKTVPDVRISTTKSEISIESSDAIKSITIYDITGKVLYNTLLQPSRRVCIDRTLLPVSPALLLVQITFEDGETCVTKLKV